MRFPARRWQRVLLIIVTILLAAACGVVIVARWGRAVPAFEREFAVPAKGAVYGDPRAFAAGKSGLAVLFGDKLHRVGVNGALESLPSPARDSFDALAMSPSGHVALAFYREYSELGSELHAARFDPKGKLEFDVALGEKRDDTCGTGHMSPAVATDGELTWVWVRRKESTLVALDATGAEVRTIEPCACTGDDSCYCMVTALYAEAGKVVAKTLRDAGYDCAWFDATGKALRRWPCGARFGASSGQGTLYWISEKPPSCPGVSADEQQRLVRADEHGCSAEALPAEDFAHGNVVGMAASERYVYVATDQLATPGWKRRLRALSDAFEPVIHRFDYAGRYLDSRWAALPRRFHAPTAAASAFGAGADGSLWFFLGQESESGTSKWSLVGLRY